MKKIVNINLHFFHYYICIIYKMSIVVDNWKVQEDRKIWISWKFFLSCFTFLWENTTSFLPSFISPIIDQPDTQKHKFFSKLVSLLFSIAAPNNHPNQSHAIKASNLELRFLTTPYCCDWFRYLLFMDRFFIEVLAPCAGTMFTIKCRLTNFMCSWDLWLEIGNQHSAINAGKIDKHKGKLIHASWLLSQWNLF